MNKLLSYFLVFILFFGVKLNGQEIKEFKTVGTQDQYVSVLFAFKNKPFSISRTNIHQDRGWLAYGTATISGIGFGWGSGNTKVKLENFTHGVKNSNNTGGRYSYIGKVSVEWISSGIIVYLRGNTTYYTDGEVKRNDGTYTARAGSQASLSAVSLDEKGYNVPPGVYVADWEINADTKNIQNEAKFKTVGTQDQYVPVLFGFSNKPFSISRPRIHEDRTWLAYGTATISGIGFGWGSGNTKIKLENFTHGVKNNNNTGGRYSYIGKVSSEWTGNGIIVYLRGNTTYYTDGNVLRNDGTYTASAGSQTSLSAVGLDEKGYNVPPGVYFADWTIDADTKSINAGTDFLSYKNGNVGIGTNDPKSKLDVNGFVTLAGDAANLDRRFDSDKLKNAISNSGKVAIGWNLSGGKGETDFISNRGLGSVGGFSFYDIDNSGVINHLLNLHNNGNAALYGKFEAKEVKVTESPTADFVFEEDYALPTLQDVEKYIKEKKHLPEIASAKQMEKEGVNIGEFQIQLLQKIEELTLYIIELNKEIQQLKNNNN